jgi:hypothetical protein
MKRILAAAPLSLLIFAPVSAAPFYAGLQISDESVGVLLGYQISKMYAIEGHYSKSDSLISHAGVTVDTSTVGAGLVGLALFPMKLNDVLPYFLFAKAGYEHTTDNETYSIPASVTLTLPYSDTIKNSKNQFIIGGGAEYDFTKYDMARMGLDFIGDNRSIYLAAIHKF